MKNLKKYLVTILDNLHKSQEKVDKTVKIMYNYV